MVTLTMTEQVKIDIVERLREDARGGMAYHELSDDAADEIERLRELLKHADDVVIWEHTPARSGFQEEIEEAIGIGRHIEQETGRPKIVGRVTGTIYDGDQVPGMPGAICHACGLKGYPCANPDCPRL